MKLKIASFLFIIFALSSCKDDSQAQQEAIAKNEKRNEDIFANINKAWHFDASISNPDVLRIISNWAEWRLLTTELEQKPKSSIGAFQQKAKTLSRKVTDLNNNIPPQFDKPEIRARIMTLSTKIKSLDLYINLDRIQEQKVLQLIPEINSELNYLQAQMAKLVKISQIQLEEGEAEMLRSIRQDSIKKPSMPSTNAEPNTNQLVDPHRDPKARK